MNYLVAVYGTLKENKHNNHYLKDSQLVEKSHTGKGYSLFVDGLPYLVKREDGTGCDIQIFKVSKETLDKLDKLEGHPFFYKRCVLKKINKKNVYIYLLNQGKESFLELDLSLSINSY